MITSCGQVGAPVSMSRAQSREDAEDMQLKICAFAALRAAFLQGQNLKALKAQPLKSRTRSSPSVQASISNALYS